MKLNLITRSLTIFTLSTVQITNFKILDTVQTNAALFSSTKPAKATFKTNPLLVAPHDWSNFFKQLLQILRVDLKNADIVKEIEHDKNLLKKKMKWYAINPKPHYKYLNIIKIPIEIYNNVDPVNKFFLIFASNNFHLQGFEWKTMWRNKKVLYYYYFKDSEIRNLDVEKEDLRLKTERYYKQLNINSNYEIFKNKKFIFTFDRVYHSFLELTRTDIDPHERWIEQNDIETIMSVTLEALKFREFEKLCDPNFNISKSDALNQWKNYFTEVIDEWGKSDEITKILKTTTDEGNINNLVLDNYPELVLPPTVFNFLEKNAMTNKYHFQLKRLDLYYDKSKKDKEITYSSTSKTDYKNYDIYDFNLKRVDPLKFKKFVFIGSTGDYVYERFTHQYRIIDPEPCWGVKVEWGGTIIINEGLYSRNCPKSSAKNGTTLNLFAENNNFDLRKILKNQKVTHNSSWGEIIAAASCELQKIYSMEGSASVSVWQKFGLTWYYDEKKHEYHLQLIIYQYLEEWTSLSTLIGTIKLGKGIRLSEFDTDLI